MKSISYILALFLLGIVISCNKEENSNQISGIKKSAPYVVNEPTGPFSYTDKDLSEDVLVTNFLQQEISGKFEFESDMGQTKDGKIWTPYISLIGYVLNNNLASEYPYEKTGYLLANGHKLEAGNILSNQYFYVHAPYGKVENPILASIDNISSLKLELYDIIGQKVIEFITRTPLPLEMELKGNKLVWNKDDNNRIGLFISALQMGEENKLSYIFTTDDGEEDIAKIIKEGNFKGNITLIIRRGTILVGKGKDNKDYKFSAFSEKRFSINAQ